MRVSKLIICWWWLGMCQLALCDSSKSSDFVSAANLLRIIEPFTVEKGHLPSSWQEIEGFYDVSRIAGGFKYKERLGFPESPIKIDHFGVTSKIVAMSLDGNGEGSVYRDDNSDNKVYEAGRILILYRQPDIFEVLRINEDALQRAFNRAEKSLSDYTGKAGKWANTAELSENRENPNGNLKPVHETNRNTDAIPYPTGKAPDREAQKNKEDKPEESYFQIWLIGILAIFLLGTLVFILRRNPKA